MGVCVAGVRGQRGWWWWDHGTTSLTSPPVVGTGLKWSQTATHLLGRPFPCRHTVVLFFFSFSSNASWQSVTTHLWTRVCVSICYPGLPVDCRGSSSSGARLTAKTQWLSLCCISWKNNGSGAKAFSNCNVRSSFGVRREHVSMFYCVKSRCCFLLCRLPMKWNWILTIYLRPSVIIFQQNSTCFSWHSAGNGKTK